ncbi:tyrosine-type recombinase/integrase [Aureimonas sp. AU4]|uniref:tyrosine-type recombinase/integrase n=1 Tax=Aureimonas sp. AU4 TaxID=1638163 RepID=UPI000782608D|nr:tyrosine-type recombinase/integrase [Aureimonas sp. AU4]
MAKKALTETFLKKVVRGDPTLEKRAEHGDTQVPELTLRVNKTSATWKVRKTVGARKLDETIGNAETLNVENARRVARAAVSHFEAGYGIDGRWLETQRIELGLQHDPRPDKSMKRVRPKTWLFEEAVAEYLKDLEKTKKPGTVTNYRETLANPACRKHFYGRAVAEIDARYAQTVIQEKAKDHSTMAEHLVRVLKPFWTWMYRWRPNESGVTSRVMLDLWTPPRPRDRKVGAHIKRPGLQKVGNMVAICRTPGIVHPTIAMAIEACILTAQRRETICSARVEDVALHSDVEPPNWTIPESSIKGNMEHAVPLVGRALDLFAEAVRSAREEGSEWVFPQIRESKRGAGLKHMSKSTLTHAMSDAAGFSPHRIRIEFEAMCQDIEKRKPHPDPKGGEEMAAVILDHVEGRTSTTAVHYGADKRLGLKIGIISHWEPRMEPYVEAALQELDVEATKARIREAIKSRQKTPKKSERRRHKEAMDKIGARMDAERQAADEDQAIIRQTLEDHRTGHVDDAVALKRLGLDDMEHLIAHRILAGHDISERADLAGIVANAKRRWKIVRQAWAAREQGLPLPKLKAAE